MFPSLPKIIGLVSVIWLVIVIFRFFESRKRPVANHEGEDPSRNSEMENEEKSPVLDLEECSICGKWHPPGPCD